MIGGWDELKLILGENKEQFKLWRPIVQEGIPWWKNNDFPWLGIMIASPVVGITGIGVPISTLFRGP